MGKALLVTAAFAALVCLVFVAGCEGAKEEGHVNYGYQGSLPSTCAACD